MLRAGFQAWAAAKQNHEVRTSEEQLAQARARAEWLRATTAPQLLGEAELSSAAREVAAGGGDQVAEQLVQLLCGLVGAMNRRELLQLLGWAVGTVATSPAASKLDTDEQERLARAVVSPNRVDDQVIDHVEAMFRHCQRQEDALGSRAVLPTVLGQRDLVRALLAECPVHLRPRLLQPTVICPLPLDITSSSSMTQTVRGAGRSAPRWEVDSVDRGEKPVCAAEK